jgi:hypothetical protein
MLVSYHNTTWHHNAEDLDLILHHCENFKSLMVTYTYILWQGECAYSHTGYNSVLHINMKFQNYGHIHTILNKVISPWTNITNNKIIWEISV